MRHPLTIAVAVGALLLLAQEKPVSAQKIMAEGIKDLATQIATNVAKEQKRKIAVLPFRELEGQPTVLGTYISEELVTDLFTIGGLEIVERSMLDKLVGELKLSQTGLIDPDTAKKVGKVAGVDAIVTGTITDLQTYVALNCRLIDAQTGHIFSAAQTKIAKDDDVRKTLGARLPPPAAGEPARLAPEPTESPEAQKPGGSRGQQQEVENFLFELKGCTLSGNSATCDVLITNKGEDRELMLLVDQIPYCSRLSRLIGDDGTEFKAIEVSLGTSKGHSVSSVLVSGVPIKARLVIGVSPEIRKATLLEISAMGKKCFMAQFRTVALTRP